MLKIMRRRQARDEREAQRQRRLREERERARQIEAEVRAGHERARELAERREHRGRGGQRPRSTDKQLDALVKAAWQQRTRVESGGSGHIKVYTPSGRIVSVPMTPSRQRTVKRIRAELRRGGIRV